MKKHLKSIMVMVVLTTLCFHTALASIAVPYADSVFSSAGVSLSSSIKATYSANTRAKCSVIKVSSCTLQIKDGSNWSDSSSLTAPTTIATNTSVFKATGSYSSSCTLGNTYRIKAIFDADGHQITRYSNEVSY